MTFVVASDFASAQKIARSRGLKNSEWTYVRTAQTLDIVTEPQQTLVLVQQGYKEPAFISEIVVGDRPKEVTKVYPIIDRVEALSEQGTRVIACS
jgi:hypothetical protein